MFDLEKCINVLSLMSQGTPSSQRYLPEIEDRCIKKSVTYLETLRQMVDWLESGKLKFTEPDKEKSEVVIPVSLLEPHPDLEKPLQFDPQHDIEKSGPWREKRNMWIDGNGEYHFKD